MSKVARRELLAAGAAGLAAGESQAGAARVVVGLIGPGGMGSNHLRLLVKRPDVEVAWLCDPDSRRLATAAAVVNEATGRSPRTADDMRRVLEDPRVDAVFIATPDHWHTPAALLALEAGKHVYVEKPMAHNVREGRLLIEAAKKSGKLLQVGTQSRSTACVQEAIDRLRKGEIGEVLVAKAWNSQRRGNIGKVAPSEPPAHLNYDLWLGPAPAVPYRTNLLPGVWRWHYDFGCGDIGNDGVHDLDVALWGLGVSRLPDRATCLGGKYFFDDDQQFPDTQYAVFEYLQDRGKTRQLIFEQRIWSPYVQEGYENGAAFYGTNGLLIIGHTIGWKLFGPRNKLLAERTGTADLPAHHDNFFACVQGKASRLNADAHSGHLAASICHLANIACRLGRSLEIDPVKETIRDDRQAAAMMTRRYRKGHWAVPRGV